MNFEEIKINQLKKKNRETPSLKKKKKKLNFSTKILFPRYIDLRLRILRRQI